MRAFLQVPAFTKRMVPGSLSRPQGGGVGHVCQGRSSLVLSTDTDVVLFGEHVSSKHSNDRWRLHSDGGETRADLPIGSQLSKC